MVMLYIYPLRCKVLYPIHIDIQVYVDPMYFAWLLKSGMQYDHSLQCNMVLQERALPEVRSEAECDELARRTALVAHLLGRQQAIRRTF